MVYKINKYNSNANKPKDDREGMGGGGKRFPVFFTRNQSPIEWPSYYFLEKRLKIQGRRRYIKKRSEIPKHAMT